MAPVPILSVFPALTVHSELKSVHPGFPGFANRHVICSNYHKNTMPETAFLGAQIVPKSLSDPTGELTALPQTP